MAIRIILLYGFGFYNLLFLASPFFPIITDRIILAFPDGSHEEKPWAWFQQKSREERERLKAWRR
ncbi:MAG: hypothetical protein ACFFAL_04670 [Promethearchaeota archaeon]